MSLDAFPEPVANVKRALTALGAEDTVTVFDSKVPTAAAAAAALGCDVAAITNSLVFDLEGAPLLILASGAAKVDVHKVAAQLGTGRIRRASPEFVLEHTGQEVGGVAPVGHPEKIRTLLDESLEGPRRPLGRSRRPQLDVLHHLRRPAPDHRRRRTASPLRNVARIVAVRTRTQLRAVGTRPTPA